MRGDYFALDGTGANSVLALRALCSFLNISWSVFAIHILLAFVHSPLSVFSYLLSITLVSIQLSALCYQHFAILSQHSEFSILLSTLGHPNSAFGVQYSGILSQQSVLLIRILAWHQQRIILFNDRKLNPLA
jgi:hypothetical protein